MGNKVENGLEELYNRIADFNKICFDYKTGVEEANEKLADLYKFYKELNIENAESMQAKLTEIDNFFGNRAMLLRTMSEESHTDSNFEDVTVEEVHFDLDKYFAVA